MTNDRADPIPDSEWEGIVRNVPLVSVDLIVLHDGGIVLGRRTNEPAKGEWFVPGGTVFKGETLKAAVHRVAETELDTRVTIERQLGVYEHFYDTADVSGVDGKHYVVIAYHVTPESPDLHPDEQHSALQTFTLPVDAERFHPYVMRYLDDIGEVVQST